MFKGWLGEKITQFILWLSLDKKRYRRFHDVIILSKNGTTQIDHILISPFGIFIVETKNYKGWIYGSESQANWMQIIYKFKHTFQNPLRQTHRHKKILAEYLGVDEAHIQTVISFVGDSQFKNKMPRNVLRGARLGSYIKQFDENVLSDGEIERICGLLANVKSESKISNKEHIQSLHDRYQSDTICPKCSSDLVVRTAKKSEGSQFLGCSNYPRCRFKKHL